MSDQPMFRIADEFNEPQFSTVRRTLPEFISDGKLVPVKPTISGIAMTSTPNPTHDGKYTVVLLMDEPLDSLTMHNRVTLLGEPA